MCMGSKPKAPPPAPPPPPAAEKSAVLSQEDDYTITKRKQKRGISDLTIERKKTAGTGVNLPGAG